MNPMAGPDQPALAVFRAREALLAISWSTAMMGDLPLTDDERYAAAVDIARDILTKS
ncbi:hypothetical protein ACQPXH_18590 [Nocardia sp. CA-135953]|uniref:hypothetical protein n=1 Tax=Nocardia sp. CA-135953 TaxID=3239978 RepID=UPI003D95B643